MEMVGLGPFQKHSVPTPSQNSFADYFLMKAKSATQHFLKIQHSNTRQSQNTLI